MATQRRRWHVFLGEDAIDQDSWPAPEIADNVNTSELGELGLTDEEEDAIVAFLETLTDDSF